MGTGWLIAFVFMKQWYMALFLVILAISSIPCWLVGKYQKLSRGLFWSQIANAIFIVSFALVFDIPSEAGPRTIHLFLLTIALVGYVNLQFEKSKAQVVLLAMTLLAFLVLNSSSISFPIEPPPSEAFREARAWINSVLATAVLCGGFYAMHIELSSTMREVIALRGALINHEFELFYQPQVDSEGKIIGAEALLRWNHPKRGYVSPAEFLPVAQQAGLLPALGSWVIREACKTLALWQSLPFTQNLTLSVNVTAEQFALPGFVDELMQATSLEKVSPKLMKLELTENAVLADIDSVADKMLMLKAAGFGMSLDDFGTGYSSLIYLRKLPLCQLKIDRSFVTGVDVNPRAASLTRNIVQIGHDLHLEVLAEGVETEAQLQTMKAFGCTSFQGFLFAKPMRLSEFEKFVADKAVS